MDPSYPDDRLLYMLEDSGATLVVIDSALLSKFPGCKAEAVLIDQMKFDQQVEAVNGRVTAANLAYLIYTSGSTGRPKGAQVSHENLLHSTLAREHFYKEPIYKYVLMSSISFDSSVAGIFWTLATGGTLLLIKEGQQRDGREVADIVRRHEASHVLCLPSFYKVLLEASSDDLEGVLRAVIVAGEECAPEVVHGTGGSLPEQGYTTSTARRRRLYGQRYVNLVAAVKMKFP